MVSSGSNSAGAAMMLYSRDCWKKCFWSVLLAGSCFVLGLFLRELIYFTQLSFFHYATKKNTICSYSENLRITRDLLYFKPVSAILRHEMRKEPDPSKREELGGLLASIPTMENINFLASQFNTERNVHVKIALAFYLSERGGVNGREFLVAQLESHELADRSLVRAALINMGQGKYVVDTLLREAKAGDQESARSLVRITDMYRFSDPQKVPVDVTKAINDLSIIIGDEGQDERQAEFQKASSMVITFWETQSDQSKYELFKVHFSP